MTPKIEHTRHFFYTFLLFVLYLGFLLIKPYLSTVVLAIITVIIFQNVYQAWLKFFKNSTSLATTFSIISVFITALVPLIFISILTLNQAVGFFNELEINLEGNNNTIDNSIEEFNTFVEGIPFVEYSLDRQYLVENLDNIVAPVGNYIVGRAPDILTISTGFITQIIVYVSLLAALFPGLETLIKKIKKASPLDDHIDDVYIKRMIAMAKSMVKGTFVISVVQSLIAAIVLWIIGVDYVAFWTVLMVFFGIIPLGVGFVTYPIAAVLLLMGNTWEGIILAGITALVIYQIDNILRPMLVSGEAHINPALVIMSVLGGLTLFGPIGFIYGPILMIFIVTTFETYIKYYRIK